MNQPLASELPDEWDITRLDGVVEPSRGRKDPQNNPELPYLGLKHFEEESMKILGKGRAGDYESNSVHFYPGDVLYGRLRPYLNKVHPVDFEGLGSGEIIVLTPGDEIIQKYLAYLLNSHSFVRYADHLSTGDRPRVNYGKIKDFEFPLPPINDQKHIVEQLDVLLSKLESGIGDLEAANEKLEYYTRSFLQFVVEGKITRQWRAERENTKSANSLLKRTAQQRENECGGKYGKLADPDDIPQGIDIPSEWTWTSLSQIGEISRGKSTHRPRDDPSLYGGEYPFIQTGEIRAADTFLNDYEKTYNEKGLEQSRLWPEGTLCITIAANIAETAVLGIEACFPDSVVGFVTNSEFCNVLYVELYFRTIQQDLERYAPATAQKNINLGTLTDLPIPLPPIEEQDEIVQRAHSKLSVIDNTTRTVSYGLIRSSRLRKSLLKYALQGRLFLNKNLSDTSMFIQEGDSVDDMQFNSKYQTELTEVVNDAE